MGYLKDFGEQLSMRLAALPEEARRETVAFVKAEVLASYKNGLRDARQERESAPRFKKRA